MIDSKNFNNPTTKEFAIGYQTNKGKEALKEAKKLEKSQVNEGKKWVFLPDGKTKVLR